MTRLMMIEFRAGRVWVAWCLFFAALCFSAKAIPASLRFVRWVNDGDTIILSGGARVRYIGLNAPEIAHEDRPAQRYGLESKRFNRKLVRGKKVRLELDRQKRDQYGRILAYVFIEDGTFVNKKLLEMGYAHYVFRAPNSTYDRVLLIAQREAMAKRLGIWKKFSNKAGSYIGNKRSKRFHRKTCRFGKATAKRNRIIFKNRYDAFWAGYSPCKKCEP